MAADLFAPVRLGELDLPNRIIMAPMTRDRAGPGDVPTAHMVEYYRQRASAGLIVTEGTQPSPAGKGYWRTPGIYSEPQVQGWRAVAEEVHGAGGKIVDPAYALRPRKRSRKQGCGCRNRGTFSDQSSDPIPGPDGVPLAADLPRALETGEIAGIVAEYAAAARNARSAGLDGVELHCASGYLPMQFLSSNSNQRTDRYGGSAANRIRFAVETLEALAAEIGPGCVGFRICPGITLNGMADADPAETYAALLSEVNRLGLAYLHLIQIPNEGFDALDLVHKNWRGQVILNSSLSLEAAHAAVGQGRADAVSFGRHFIGNPDLVERFRSGGELARADRSTYYTGGGDDRRGYTDYPKQSGRPA